MMLGGGQHAGGLYVSVINVHASTTIARGRVVALSASGTVPAASERGAGANTHPAILIPVTVWSSGSGFGVAMQDIPAGEEGTVCIFGVCLVETDGDVQDTEELELTTGGVFDTLSTGEAVGYALFDDFTEDDEADYGTSTTTYTLAMVGFSQYARAADWAN